MPCWIEVEGEDGFVGVIRSARLRPEEAIARVGATIFVFLIHLDDGRAPTINGKPLDLKLEERGPSEPSYSP